MKRSGLRVPIMLFIGMFLMQLAWILAVPPFAAIDEFDHAYRAEAVAHGQWMPPYVAPQHGRGGLVEVPRDVVIAAGPECRALKYTGPDNCSPVKDIGGGMVEVASAASTYNPIFYWVMGTPARLFNGAEALYAMRMVAAVLCAAFVALAGWAASRWAQTRWPVAALMVALTPVAIYSTSVAAPNGIEMCAALALWTAILGLSRPNLSRRTERALLYTCVPSGMVLATVRFLGPLWFGLAIVTVVLLAGISRIRRLVARSRRQLAIAGGLIAAAAIANLWWILADHVLGQGSAEPVLFHDPVRNTIGQIPLWIFQGIAAFPYRNDRAPTIVYVAVALVLAALLGWGGIRAGRRLRWAITLVLVLSVAIPFGLTILEYPRLGTYWQGRYGLPYTFGLMLLAGYAFETNPPRHRLTSPAVLAAWLGLAIANAVGVVNVLNLEKSRSPSVGSPNWLVPQPWMVVALTIVGWLTWGLLMNTKLEIIDLTSEANSAEPGGYPLHGTSEGTAVVTAEGGPACSTDQ